MITMSDMRERAKKIAQEVFDKEFCNTLNPSPEAISIIAAALAQSDAEPTRDVILRRCERWLRHHVEATFQEESGYDLWEAVKAALAQSESPCGALSRTRTGTP